MGAFDPLAGLTARLASTARLDEFADAVLSEIVELGFGAVWIAVLDDQTGALSTLKDTLERASGTPAMPKLLALDLLPQFGAGMRERRVINVVESDALPQLVYDEGSAPLDELALPRALRRYVQGPFACGVLLGGAGQPVGAFALSSYHGGQPIPDAVASDGLLRAILDHLAIAMDRAFLVARIGRLDASLRRQQEAVLGDARLKAVGELAASAAHDLNNLSVIIQFSVEVGARSPDDALEVLPQIERANRAIGELVARLQRVARPPSRDAQAANLKQIVDDVRIMVTSVLREQSIEIDVDLPPVPLVRCDAVLIHQVVLNLVINARDALRDVPREHRRIAIAIAMRDAGGVVRLTVADSGPGIAPEILAHLFQPFITTKGLTHTGLGLAAARAALQPFGGQIVGRNAPTGGAVFEVALVVAPPGVLDSSVWIRPSRRALASRDRGRATIIAVDDDTDVTDVIRVCLEPRYEVVTATGPGEAIEAATARTFDLVLCDISLPKQSGLDVCMSLRRSGYRGKLVLMTGLDSQTLSSDQRAAECDALLEKPFGCAELIGVIESLLDA